MLKKIKLSYVIYSVIALITAVLVISLTVWASKGASINVNYIDGEVLLSDDGVRNEYLVGQAIDSTGVSLKVGRKVFTGDDLEFNVDNSSAGSKMVEVFHRDDNDYYRGYYLVTYFAVRHLDMRKAPTGVTVDADGNFVVEGMELWAELSGKPTSFPQPDEQGLETVIIVDERNYTLEVEAPDENGGRSAKLNCGPHSVNFYFVDVLGEMVVVENFDRIALFENVNGTGESLAMCVTSRDGRAEGKVNIADGYFIYVDNSGDVHKYQFDYYMIDQQWDSVFNSNDVSLGFGDGGALLVTVNGVTFSTPRSSWCLAILNNPNP